MSRSHQPLHRGKVHLRTRASQSIECGELACAAPEPRGVSPTRIAAVRRQIAAGTYLTAEKLDAAIDKLFEELRAPAPRRAAVG